jgi:hypothetical protein
VRTDGLGGANVPSDVRKCSPNPRIRHFCQVLLRDPTHLRSYRCVTSQVRPHATVALSVPSGVYVRWWHDLCITYVREGGNRYALPVVALLRGVQVSPSLPWPSSPTRPRLPSRPGSHLVSCTPDGAHHGRPQARLQLAPGWVWSAPGFPPPRFGRVRCLILKGTPSARYAEG